MKQTARILAALAPLLAGCPGPMAAQDALFGGPQTKAAPHVTWKVSVEPAEVRPGGRAEVVASYETVSGWHIYAPDHAATGLPTKLTLESPAIRVEGEPRFPAPLVKEESLLNEVHRLLEGKGEIRQAFVLPPGASPGSLTVPVKVRFMACDARGCDPPRTHAAQVELRVVDGPPAASAPAAAAKPVELKARHVTWKVRLEPAEAPPGGRVEVVVAYATAKGWHLYSPDHTSAMGLGKATAVTVESPAFKVEGKPTFPPPIEMKGELTLGETHRFLEGTGEIRQKLSVSTDAKPGALSFKARIDFMTCDKATCDPPEKVEAELSVSVTDGKAAPAPAAPGPRPEAEAAPAQGGNDDIIQGGLFLFILAMIGGGLLALALPCTYPIIPLTITFFTKQAEGRKGSVLPLALAYGAGIVLIFNVIGWAFAAPIGRFAADKWVNLVFGVAFVLFALSFFGLFELRLPSFLNTLASRATGATGYLGVFLLGATLVITSFTCTAPILGALLAFATKGGDLGRVTIGMTTFGLTMAIPFVFLSLFPTRMKSLPRAGEWMHTLKVWLGFGELALAFKFFSNFEGVLELGVLPREYLLIIWTAIFLAAGLYLIGVFRMPGEERHRTSVARRSTGVVNLAVAGYFFYGALGYPLDWITTSILPPYHASWAVKRTPWTLVTDDLGKGLSRARTERKRALINFTGFT